MQTNPSLKKDSKVRRLKINPQIRNYDPRMPIPEIKLSGKWLEAAGFETGHSVLVLISEKQLIITVEQ